MQMKNGGINLAIALSKREISWYLAKNEAVSLTTASVTKTIKALAVVFVWASAAVSFQIFL